MTRNHYLRTSAFICGSILAFVLTGCVTKQAGPTRSQRSAAAHSAAAQAQASAYDRVRPAGVSDSMIVRAAVLPLGAVPYDDMVLPLVSPDGQFIAAQTGMPPTWEAVLAEPDADESGAAELGGLGTRIEIYMLDRRDLGASARLEDLRSPQLIATLDEPVLLGRSCDGEGFIVESPREDGSRWIGKASWATGAIQWLVTGEEINAFAALGPDGRLAWSRRAHDDDHFHIVVRLPHAGPDDRREEGPDSATTAGGANEWAISTPGSDWLMPEWSGRGSNLFAMNVSGGKLEARYGNAASLPAFRQSVQRFRIADRADLYVTYQTLAGQAANSHGPSAMEQLVFFHPDLRRVCIWRPLAAPGRRAMHLNAGSIAALAAARRSESGHDSSVGDAMLVTTRESLISQSLANTRSKIDLVAGLQIPRATPLSPGPWAYLLLSPGEGYIGLTAMALLPVETAGR